MNYNSSNILAENVRIVTTRDRFFFSGATGELDVRFWVQLVRQSNFSMDHKPRYLSLGLYYYHKRPKNNTYLVETGTFCIK